MGNDRSLTEDEESVKILHPHWETLAGPIAVAVVIVAVVIAADVLLPSGSAMAIVKLAILAAGIVLLLWRLGIPLLRWRTTKYELTTKRVRVRTGIFSRTGRDFPLSRIDNISYQVTLLDRIFNSGTLVLESAGEHGDLVLDSIPHVEALQAQLFQMIEDERDGDDESRHERQEQ